MVFHIILFTKFVYLFLLIFQESLKILSDFFLQLLGSKEELNSRPMQLLSSQILTGEIIIPLLDFLADPDNLNQQIIWLVYCLIYIYIYIYKYTVFVYNYFFAN